MRSSLALLLVAAGTLCLAASPDVKTAPKPNVASTVNVNAPPAIKDVQIDDELAKIERDETPLPDMLNTTSRGAAINNPAYLRHNPRLYVKIIYSIDDRGALFINHGTRSARSRREIIRVVQRTTNFQQVRTWRGWLRSGSVVGYRAVNSRGVGGLIFSMYVKVGGRWIPHISGKYPVRLHTFSPRSKYLGWMKVNYRPCRWQKALGSNVHNIRIARKFPYRTGAKYTWALRRYRGKTVHHRGHVIFRYKLGGECGFRPKHIPPPRPAIRPNMRRITIYFAADNVGYLFINGRRKRFIRNKRGRVYVRMLVRVGTTIGFQATNSGGVGGMISTMIVERWDARGRRRVYRLNTGKYPFRVHAASRNRRFNHIWKFPSYKTCRWPRATKAYAHDIKIARNFPYQLGAKYIWFPKAKTRRGTMFMRYTVGGERCHPRPRRNYRLVTINFAADNVGYLFINGRRRRYIKNHLGASRFRGWVRLGSTIGIQARNLRGPGGIITSILVQHGRRKYRLNTGKYPFRVHLAWTKRSQRRLNHIWKFPAYKTCNWPRATSKYVHNLRISRRFPYRTGAKYIWVAGNRNFVGTLFLRYRLGGERCKRPPPPGPLPGRGCPCRKSTNPKRGECFHFIGREPTGNRNGPCRKKTCEIKYECTTRARAKGRCIWRFATDEVRAVGGRGRLMCRRVRLEKKQPFLVPYSG